MQKINFTNFEFPFSVHFIRRESLLFNHLLYSISACTKMCANFFHRNPSFRILHELNLR